MYGWRFKGMDAHCIKLKLFSIPSEEVLRQGQLKEKELWYIEYVSNTSSNIPFIG